MLSLSVPQCMLLGTIVLSHTISASWVPDMFQGVDVLNKVEKRCANPCGYYGQLCCQTGEVCYTDANNQAQCGVGGSGSNSGSPQNNQNGQWQYYTTTYVQTDLKTITTTFSSFVPYVTAPATATLSCSFSQGQAPCGNVCCIAGQYCAAAGSCMQIPGGSSAYYGGVYTVTQYITGSAAGPGIRPTTQTILTLSATGSVTGTASFQNPVGTGGAMLSGTTSSGGGLSGGAIAGIVIGVIIGVIILILICACFCFKGLIDGLLAIFGLGSRKRRRTEETYIEERRSHHSGAGRTWWGQPKKTTEVITEKKESSGFARIASVAGILGGLALILGLKRKHDRKDDASVSGYGSSAYYYSDYGSDTSPSSVTRTRSRSRSRYSRR